MNKNLKVVIDKINSAKTIAVFSHIKPDGDAVCSMCAFFSYSQSLGLEVDIYLDGHYAEVYNNFLPNVDKIRHDDVQKSYELLVCLDTSSLSRLGGYGTLFKRHPNTIRIDHHADDFGADTVSYVDQKKSSVCEMLFDIFKKMGAKISAETATCLMTGILTDTGNFKHANASASTFKVTAELIDLGAKRAEISENLFKSTPLNVLKLKAYIINKIEVYGNITFCILTLKDFGTFGTTSTEMEDAVDLLINIKNINYAIFVYETMPQFFNISLRGKIGHPVREFAVSIGGGGHDLAAGAKMRGTMTKVKENIISLAKKGLK